MCHSFGHALARSLFALSSLSFLAPLLALLALLLLRLFLIFSKLLLDSLRDSLNFFLLFGANCQLFVVGVVAVLEVAFVVDIVGVEFFMVDVAMVAITVSVVFNMVVAEEDFGKVLLEEGNVASVASAIAVPVFAITVDSWGAVAMVGGTTSWASAALRATFLSATATAVSVTAVSTSFDSANVTALATVNVTAVGVTAVSTSLNTTDVAAFAAFSTNFTVGSVDVIVARAAIVTTAACRLFMGVGVAVVVLVSVRRSWCVYAIPAGDCGWARVEQLLNSGIVHSHSLVGRGSSRFNGVVEKEGLDLAHVSDGIDLCLLKINSAR